MLLVMTQNGTVSLADVKFIYLYVLSGFVVKLFKIKVRLCGEKLISQL